MSSNRRNYLMYNISCTIGDLNSAMQRATSRKLDVSCRVHESDNVEFAVPSEVLCLLILSKISYKVKSVYISAYRIAILCEGILFLALLFYVSSSSLEASEFFAKCASLSLSNNLTVCIYNRAINLVTLCDIAIVFDANKCYAQ